jgi:hypothetical protein
LQVPGVGKLLIEDYSIARRPRNSRRGESGHVAGRQAISEDNLSQTVFA